MSISQLKIQGLRNLTDIEMTPDVNFNLLIGVNGSGKTSILEAIYLLSYARSFRSHLSKRLINYEQEQLSLFAKLNSSGQLGLQKNVAGETLIRINNKKPDFTAELAKYLPTQLIEPKSHQLLDAGPSFRRRFLDWGVFHVEPLFLSAWRQMHQALKQRNSALRAELPEKQIRAWDEEFLRAAISVNNMRRNFIELFQPVFANTLSQLLKTSISFNYYQGWAAQTSFEQALNTSFTRDKLLKCTQVGPQRADLRFKIDQIPVQDMLSRGQQKLLVFALILAQGQVLKNYCDKSCVYLIDDLAAELDEQHRQLVVEQLMALEAQIFITGVDRNVLLPLTDLVNSYNVFDLTVDGTLRS